MRFKKIQTDINRNEEKNTLSINEDSQKKPTTHDLTDLDKNQDEYKKQQQKYINTKQNAKKVKEDIDSKEMKQATSQSVPEKQEYEQIPSNWQNANYTKEGLSTYTKKFL